MFPSPDRGRKDLAGPGRGLGGGSKVGVCVEGMMSIYGRLGNAIHCSSELV